MSEMIRTRVELPREMVEMLKQRGEAQGLTLAQQIAQVLKAHLDEQEDPVLRADDPIFRIAGAMKSSVGDLSACHDRYLYERDWQKRSQEGSAG